jgi:hypothetical protein
VPAGRPFTTVAGTDLDRIPDFQHNKVTVWLKNTANTTLTLRQFAASGTPRFQRPPSRRRRDAGGGGLGGHERRAHQSLHGSSVTLTPSSLVTPLDARSPS